MNTFHAQTERAMSRPKDTLVCKHVVFAKQPRGE